MRIFAVLLLSSTMAFAANRAIDGDTVVIAGETIRIANIDTPEIHQAKCDAELRLGLVAKARMVEIVADGVTIVRGDHGRMKDRYGRTLARLYMTDGRDVGQIMIDEGLARRWAGQRRPWCD